MTNTELLKRNKCALQFLANGDLIAAEKLLKENAKLYPEYITFNNLGLFYAQDDFPKHGLWRFQSFYYLLNAYYKNRHPLILANLAQILFDDSKLLISKIMYARAYKLSDADMFLYNAAVCAAVSGHYRLAAKGFLPTVIQENHEIILSGGNPYLPLSVLRHRGIVNFQVSRTYTEFIYSHADLHDKLIMLYCDGRYQDVCALAPTVIDEWSIEDYVYAMICDSYLRSGILPNSSRFRLLAEKCSYISAAHEILTDRHICQALIEQAQPVPALVRLCGYFACPLHDNQFNEL